MFPEISNIDTFAKFLHTYLEILTEFSIFSFETSTHFTENLSRNIF